MAGVKDGGRDVWPVWLAEKDKRVCHVCGEPLRVTKESLEFRHPDDGSGPPVAAHCSCLSRARIVMEPPDAQRATRGCIEA